MYGDVEEGMDDILSIQGIYVIKKKICSMWYLLAESSFICYKVLSFTCSSRSNKTNTIVWVGHMHITFTYFSCFITFDEISNLSKQPLEEKETMSWLEICILIERIGWLNKALDK